MPYHFGCRVNTFRRLDLLETFLAHYHRCDAVRQLQVIWSDPDNAAPLEWSKRFVDDKVVFEVHNTDSLNHRFHNILPIPTEVLLLRFSSTVFILNVLHLLFSLQQQK